jgi:hypothetical protein
MSNNKSRRQLMIMTPLALASLVAVAGATPAAADKDIKAATGSSCWDTCTADERVPINSSSYGFKCIALVDGTDDGRKRKGTNAAFYRERSICYASFGQQWRPYPAYFCTCSDPDPGRKGRRR